MYSVALYALVRRACRIDGMSKREAARVSGIGPKTVDRMAGLSVPPGIVVSIRRVVRSWTVLRASSTGFWRKTVRFTASSVTR